MTLFLTGCTVEYNLTFKDNVLTENIDINASDSSLSLDEIKQMLEDQMPTEGSNSDFYEVDVKKNKIIELTNDYNIVTYKDSPILSQCYTAYNFIQADEYYDLTTSQTFRCNPFDYMVIDEIKIKIKTNHKVISHNADEVKGNTYIWKITTENANYKPIKIRFSKEKEQSSLGLIILGITAIIAIIIVSIVLMVKKSKNNEI